MGIWLNLKTRLTYNSFRRSIIKFRAETRGDHTLEVTGLKNVHYWILLNSAAIIGLGFYSGLLCSLTRKKTFGRN